MKKLLLVLFVILLNISFFSVYALELTDSKYTLDSNNCISKIIYPAIYNDPEYSIENTYYPGEDCIVKSSTSKGDSFYYDSKGNLLKESVNEDGITKDTLYSYDSDNRLIKISYLDKTIEYSYDSKGNLIRVNDGNDVLEYEYDSAGELIKTTENGEITESYSCDKGLCEYFDGAQYYYSKIPETICDGKDDNSNSIIDEGCDNDGDYYVNPEMKCEGSFSAKISNTGDNVIGKVKTDGKGIINLISGWNMVSFPVAKNIPVQELVNSCEAIAFEYDSNKKYSFTPENIVSGKAYLVYSMKNCNFDINKYGLLESVQVNMQNGWNLVSGFDNLERVYQKSDGDFISWDRNYLNSITLDSTKGVWVYWDKNKKSRIVSCSKIDKDDNNAEIRI